MPNDRMRWEAGFEARPMSGHLPSTLICHGSQRKLPLKAAVRNLAVAQEQAERGRPACLGNHEMVNVHRQIGLMARKASRCVTTIRQPLRACRAPSLQHPACRPTRPLSDGATSWPRCTESGQRRDRSFSRSVSATRISSAICLPIALSSRHNGWSAIANAAMLGQTTTCSSSFELAAFKGSSAAKRFGRREAPCR